MQSPIGRQMVSYRTEKFWLSRTYVRRPYARIRPGNELGSGGNPRLLAGKIITNRHDWTSLLWPIDSCQNKVSADQYHMTISRAQM